VNTENREIETEMGLFTKSAKRVRDEAAVALEAARKHHAELVDEHNKAVDHVAALKLQRLNERKEKTAAAVAKRSGSDSMADDDPALMQKIAKATLYKRGLFKAAEDARLAVLAAEDALVAAERDAEREAYMSQAQVVYRLLAQLVPANDLLKALRTSLYFPNLSLPEWDASRWEYWKSEYDAAERGQFEESIRIQRWNPAGTSLNEYSSPPKVALQRIAKGDGFEFCNARDARRYADQVDALRAEIAAATEKHDA
jgi:hypothetical protein